MSKIPSSYLEGYSKALRVDPVWAELYVKHTQVGDPVADALLLELNNHDAALAQQWIHRGIEGGSGAIPEAPAIVRQFFDEAARVPAWFDPAKAMAGCRAFHRNSEMITGAFVGAVLIEGFSTLIAKSFSITGRLVDAGVRRLQQNNRHLIEIFMPGGLDRESDGWKLSVRIRLVHARVRLLLSHSEDWDSAAWGVPLSASHIAFATAAFSALLLKRAAMLGVHLNQDERESFMMIWRYSGYLMGVLPELLFEDEESALHLLTIGGLCEPPPDLESILMANGLIQSAPLVAGFNEPSARRSLANKIFRISRALIGNELADKLHYPKFSTFGVLTLLQFQNRFDHLLQRMFPRLKSWRLAGRFQQMLEVSHYGEEGLGYRVPGHVHAEKDSHL